MWDFHLQALSQQHCALSFNPIEIYKSTARWLININWFTRTDMSSILAIIFMPSLSFYSKKSEAEMLQDLLMLERYRS